MNMYRFAIESAGGLHHGRKHDLVDLLLRVCNDFIHPPLPLSPRTRSKPHRVRSRRSVPLGTPEARRTRCRKDRFSLALPFLEAPELSFLLRVRDVDHAHRQLGEAVSPS